MKKPFVTSVKQYLLTVIVSLLAVLLFELIFYPLIPAQIARNADVETMGSTLVLTDETPQELRIYHRALLLPRYKLHSAWKLPEPECSTANADFFQIFVISIENRQIVLYDQHYNAKSLWIPFCFIWFTILFYQTWVQLYQWAKRRKQSVS